MSFNSGMIQGISVVTTSWNEVKNIEEVIRRVRSTLQNIHHEIIVVDDSSSDGTLKVAERFADIAVGKIREGQTKGLLYGAKLAKFPVIVTIDCDLENPPELIPTLINEMGNFDLVVASRKVLPRFSERWAAKTLGKLFGVSDFYSNFRAYTKESLASTLKGGETFGGELLIIAAKKGCKIGEITYDSPPRRGKPRIGGSIRANLRILFTSLKCFLIYMF